jgi:starch synthase (maltosyl-transferring)
VADAFNEETKGMSMAPAVSTVNEGRRRVVISGVRPEIDGGRFPVKRVVGEKLVVEADIFTYGQDRVFARLLYRREEDSRWAEAPMEPSGNDRWSAEFVVRQIGRYRYTLLAGVDDFATWRVLVQKRAAAGQDVANELLVGARLVAEAAARAPEGDAATLRRWEATLREEGNEEARLRAALDPRLLELMGHSQDLSLASRYAVELVVVVDREMAVFSAWYEMFPRSAGGDGRHGTFRDCESRLPYVAGMGFDVIYLPPIHPIGVSSRKGRDNSTAATPGDPGSPWAIGAPEGGHTAVHPDLGSLDEFHSLLAGAKEHGVEVAVDLAFQCSPDHPWVHEHPEWFRHRPDGSIQYAENPPKKYEDIFPLDFETDGWRDLWDALAEVVFFWIEQGVRIFRVDNPHTKPFDFWEWLIAKVKERHPEVIFLAEAFTRPHVMYRLAKVGFSQSYTYFAWRNTAWELTEFMRELTHTQVREYFRPNLWPNTPDILSEYLQVGGRAAFVTRLVLAATLGASYGIYGPAFELCEASPREPGSEEYLESEKYQVRRWDLDREDSLRPLITRVNRVRRENPALHSNESLHFHAVTNETMLCYSKSTPDFSNVVLAVVNLDPHHTQSGWVELDLEAIGLTDGQTYQVHDLLGDARFLWSGRRNFVQLRPEAISAHVLRVRRRTHTERDFEYYL